MKFRRKVLFLLLTATGISLALLCLLTYLQARRDLFNQLRSNVLSVAIAGALEIDLEKLEEIRAKEDATRPAYLEIRDKLVRLRDANRRHDLNVRFISLIRADPKKASGYAFILNSEEDASKDKVWPGDEYPDYPEPLHLNAPYADENVIKDQWGSWLRATAPVLDENGSPVALVGVRVSTDEIAAKDRALLGQAGLALALGLGVAAILAAIISRWVSAPLQVVRQGVEDLALGNFEPALHVRSGDEIEELADAVNRTGAALREREILKSATVQFVTDRIVEKHFALQALAGGAEQRNVTLLHIDLTDFGRLASQIAFPAAREFIHHVGITIVEAIIRHRGMLQICDGNAFITLFGASSSDAEHALHAVEAALSVRREVGAVCATWMPLARSIWRKAR